MNGTVSISSVLRRTFDAYVRRAPQLLAAALMLTTVIWLDNALFERAAVAGAGLVNLVLLALFVCFVVLGVDEMWNGEARRSVSELLRSAWSAAGRLLLVALIAGLAIGFVGSSGSGLLVAIILGAAFAAGANLVTLVVGLLLIAIVLLVPELYLLTVWSVFRPGRRAGAPRWPACTGSQPRAGARQRLAGPGSDPHAHTAAVAGSYRSRGRLASAR